MEDTAQQKIKLFYCYAREDKALREELEIHLSGLKRQYHLINWSDQEIIPGENWEQAINTHLDTADVILLLISPHFMASDYCYGTEMQRALERHLTGVCCVIPILIRPTYYWEEAPFSSIQMLPTDARPITRWPDRDEAFHDVAKGISASIKAWLAFRNSGEEKHEKAKEKPTRVKQHNPDRLHRGERTPEEAYYRPILTAIDELGGSAKMNDVLERVEQIMRNILKPPDYERLGSGTGMLRWRNTAQWTRYALVKEGLLKSKSPRGIWEITEAGHTFLNNQNY